MDGESASWQAPRDCACGAAASIGYATCAPCRVRPLVARHLPALAGVTLTERRAQAVERALREADAALDVARTQIALAAGEG